MVEASLRTTPTEPMLRGHNPGECEWPCDVRGARQLSSMHKIRITSTHAISAETNSVHVRGTSLHPSRVGRDPKLQAPSSKLRASLPQHSQNVGASTRESALRSDLAYYWAGTRHQAAVVSLHARQFAPPFSAHRTSWNTPWTRRRCRPFRCLSRVCCASSTYSTARRRHPRRTTRLSGKWPI